MAQHDDTANCSRDSLASLTPGVRLHAPLSPGHANHNASLFLGIAAGRPVFIGLRQLLCSFVQTWHIDGLVFPYHASPATYNNKLKNLTGLHLRSIQMENAD